MNHNCSITCANEITIGDNSKIVDAAPDFRNFKPFAVGIAETIKNYESNPRERTIDYEWDGRIDWAIPNLQLI